jgi:hypothetical protein
MQHEIINPFLDDIVCFFAYEIFKMFKLGCFKWSARQTHDFCYNFGKILLPRDRAGVRQPICVMNSIKSVGKVA